MEEINEIVDEAMQESIADDSQQLSDDFDELEKSPFQGKYHKQSYRKAWESLPDFKGWLEGVVGQPNRAFCSYCQVTLFAHRLSLLKHTCTIKHQKASQKALYAKSNGIISDGTKVSIIPSTSQPTMQHISDSIKLNLRPVKVQQGLTSNMTVTIIQDESDDQLGLQLAQNISNTDNSALITDDDDLGLNTVQSVELEVEEVAESQVSPTESLSMAHSSNFPLSTHVLDTSKGQPVTQLPVSLYRLIDSRWTLINESVTNQDGRCSGLIQKEEFVAGRYKLHFDTDRYFELERKETLYPFVEIAFDVHAPLDHYHIPLLLSAFGYSTYRGS